jgi:ribosomal protein L11 methyltransferase
MKYIEIAYNVSPTVPGNEILIAQLNDLPVDSLIEEEDIVKAYVQEDQYDEAQFEALPLLTDRNFTVVTNVSEIEEVNWNEEWEKNFDPVRIDRSLLIKADFHSDESDFEHVITINPKMSFGTGHHATTSGVCRLMMEEDFQDKSVLDMGCGTGILAIFARMLGAKEAIGIDIDEWSYENARENVERNGYADIEILHGGAEVIPVASYDVIIANINRNILLDDMHHYAEHLKAGGRLYLSGFYVEDLKIIREACATLGIKFDRYIEQDNWVAALFKK